MSAEAAQIARFIAEIYTPAEAQAWMESPQPLLSHGIPCDMIAAGEGSAVLACLQQLVDGAYL